MSDDILESLAECDGEMQRALADAIRACAFATSVMLGPDNHAAIHVASGKPESSPPGSPEMAWAYHAMLRRLHGIDEVHERLVQRMDDRRGPERAWKEPEEESAKVGRPTEITAAQVQQVFELRQAGYRPTGIANAGIMPPRTFWQALKRGRDATGIERDLWLAVYGG